MFTGQNSEVWQCLSANACPLVWHFFENFCNNENPCLIRFLACLGYSGIAFANICQLADMGKEKAVHFVYCFAFTF
ncbi:hypothetical protein DU508_17155 [Pedobacter chinensis]|uniref:Uncharacterized protein n=2 Tax=Sphingobacteriaceae TaxID=84566 RepID=A0A369PRN9_9SPHI|nr:MAG: hypothetical protein DI598_13900 [Pseudopedobacter saltans]RDC55301.1 hypothetical protein DU508_17155 [Pedobacter chinensis]